MDIPSPARMFKWLILVFVYLQGLSICTAIFGFSSGRAIGPSTLLSCFPSLIVIGVIMYAVFLMFKKDKERENNPSDDFKDGNLLYRYGYEVNEDVIPIPVDSSWTEQQILSFVSAMRHRIAYKFRERFSSSKIEIIESFTIKDKDMPSDARNFLKIIFRSIRGSQVSHFVDYEIMGKYIVVHYVSKIRGKYRWHDVADFVIMGPLTIWFWGIGWLQNQYSIVAAISKIVYNSYDQIDLKSFFTSSYLVTLDETRIFLKENNLLTDELNQIIMHNINNSQNINITGSPGTSLSGLTNTVQNVGRSVVKTS